jgi:hypothetical protein
MGYDVKMKIGEFHPESKDKKIWFQPFAEVDLCVIGQEGELPKLVKSSLRKKNQGIYWYADNGNDTIEQDCYGDYPTPVPLKDVLAALEEDVRNDPDRYRRTRWALALVRAMWETEHEHKSDSIKVMFFGH